MYTDIFAGATLQWWQPSMKSNESDKIKENTKQKKRVMDRGSCGAKGHAVSVCETIAWRGDWIKQRRLFQKGRIMTDKTRKSKQTGEKILVRILFSIATEKAPKHVPAEFLLICHD
jgi:hypothetical protein